MITERNFETRINLAADVRARLIDLLNEQLADTFDLFSQAKQAHWNVKGAQFYQLHELFDRLAGELEGHVDMIAERVTALGGIAMGTVRMAAQRSRLPEYDLEITDSQPIIDALAARFADLARAPVTPSRSPMTRETLALRICSQKCRERWTRHCGSLKLITNGSAPARQWSGEVEEVTKRTALQWISGRNAVSI